MAENQLLRFANGSLPNVISYAEWKNLPEVTKGFVSGIAKSANMNRVIAQGALAGYVMGQAIVNLLEKNATLESSTFYEDFLAALCKHIPGNVADASIPTAKLAQLATYQDIESGVASKVVCADVLKQYLDTLVPTGACQCFLCKTAPTGWMELDGSRVDKEDAPDLVNLLWQFDLTKGDTTSYAMLPNMNGRVFQGTTTVADVCKYLEASLPNINGYFQVVKRTSIFESVSGCFSANGDSGGEAPWDIQSGGMAFGVTLNAANANSTYSGNKLQASALHVLPCIRV